MDSYLKMKIKRLVLKKTKRLKPIKNDILF